MSRLGKTPITIPQGVEVKIEDKQITVKGSKGELIQKIHPRVSVEKVSGEVGEEIITKVKDVEDKQDKAFWGLTASLIRNMILGVTEGFEKKLEINGVGYKAAISGSKLTLNLGYSHPIIFELPKGITGVVEGNVITISGIDKQQVGETAAQIRKFRKPEPYKGKGIKYIDEVIIRKAGKDAKSGE